MEAAAQVVRERGFARIVGEVAISAARNQAEHGETDPGCQSSPHPVSKWSSERPLYARHCCAAPQTFHATSSLSSAGCFRQTRAPCYRPCRQKQNSRERSDKSRGGNMK